MTLWYDETIPTFEVILTNSFPLVERCKIIPLSRAGTISPYFYKGSITTRVAIFSGLWKIGGPGAIRPDPCPIDLLEANPASPADHRLHKGICCLVWDQNKVCCWLGFLTCQKCINPVHFCLDRFVTFSWMFEICPSRITYCKSRIDIKSTIWTSD